MKAIRSRFFRTLLFASSLAALAGAEPEKAAPEEAMELPKFTVQGHAVCSYGIAISGVRDPATKRVKRLFITEVTKDSLAERRGLQAGDEIIGLNGVKVAGMDGVMKPGSQLFDLMINQPDGRQMELEVVVHTTKTLVLKAGQ